MNWVKQWKMNPKKHRLDGWRVDYVDGDCNDFALTMAWDLAGRNLIKFLIHLIIGKSVIWWVWSEYNGIVPKHVALYHRGKGWIDSNHIEWRDKHLQTHLALPLTLPPFIIWLLCRIIWGKIYSIFR